MWLSALPHLSHLTTAENSSGDVLTIYVISEHAFFVSQLVR